jgi:hypothetical protein
MSRDPKGLPRITYVNEHGNETDEFGRDYPRISQSRTQRNPISDWNHEPRRKSNKTRNNRPASVAMGTAITLALIAGSANLSSKHQRLTTMNKLKQEFKKLDDEKEKVVRIRTHIQKMPGQPGGGYLSRDKSVELEKLTTRAFGRDDAPSILRRLSKPSYRRSSPELDVLEEGGDGSVYNKDEVDHVLNTLNINREINKQQKKNLQSATRVQKKAQKISKKVVPHKRYRHQQSHRGGNRNTRRTSR